MKKLYLQLLLIVSISTWSFAQTVPQFYNNNTGSSCNSWPLNAAVSGSNKCQWVYAPNVFSSLGGGAGTPAYTGLITTIYFRFCNPNPSYTYNISMSLGQNVGVITTFPNGTYITGLTQAFTQPAFSFTGATSYSWYAIPLTTPVLYNPNLSLVFEMYQTSGAGNSTLAQVNSTNNRIYGNYQNTSGTAGSGLVDFGFDLIPPTPCAGTPNSGNVILDNGDLVLKSNTVALDLIYQWQKKEFCPGSLWQNIAGATSPSVTPFDPSGDYRCIVTCTNSGLSDTTAPYYVPVIDTATGDSVLVATGGGFYCSDSTATVTMTANALDPSIPHTILWVGPNGFTSNSNTLTFPRLAGASGPSGIYRVYLMSDPCGSNPDVYDEAEIELFIQQTPPPPSVASLITYCLGSPADSIANQVYGQNIKWYSTPDSGTGTSVPPIVNTTLPGTYTYYVSQTYQNCESGRVPVTVRVVPQAPPPTVTTPYNYCQDDPAVALEAVGQNLLWYSVDSGGVGSSVVPTPSTATEGQTIWYVSQTIDGCESIRVPIEVNVSFRPNAVIVPSNKWVCAGEVLTIRYDGNAKGNTNVTFNWSFPQGITILSGSGEGPYQIRFDSAGTKRITLIVDNNGCKSREARYDIEVRPLPEYRIQMQEEACAGDVVNVSIIQLTPGVDTFLWDIAGGEKVYASETAGPYGIQWTDAGIKTISIIGRDNLCASPAETDEILIRALPDANFSVGGERVCAGDSMRLDARYNADYSYQWLPEQFFPVNHTSSVYAMVSHASDITLHVTDIYNCTSSSSQWITPENCCDILLPNAFTPNSDGRNDEFKILTNGNQKLSRFVIKNRWGQQVFETADATQGWDGSYGGVAQDMGVYFYYIKYLCSDGKYYEKSGELTLIR